jgi:ribosome-binding protein aMBF1 (putative translation factor)
MSSPNLQDHRTFIIKKKSTNPNKQENSQTKLKYQAGKNTQNKSDVDMRKIENEKIKLATSTLDIKKSMQEARVSKGWTQDDLAKNCNLPKETIRDYENGKAVVKQVEISKINKALGIQLKKPKTIKLTDDDL